MESSIMLYIVNMLTYDNGGNGGAGLADYARWFGCSKPTAQKHLRGLCEYGVVREIKKSVPRGDGFRYEYSITKKGREALEADGAIIALQFKAWQEQKLIALLDDARKKSKGASKKIKRHEKQLSLFGDE